MNLPSEIRIGQIYKKGEEFYILSQVDYSKIALICLKNFSNRCAQPVIVDLACNVTYEEFKRCAFRWKELEYIGMVEDVLSFKKPEKHFKVGDKFEFEGHAPWMLIHGGTDLDKHKIILVNVNTGYQRKNDYILVDNILHIPERLVKTLFFNDEDYANFKWIVK